MSPALSAFVVCALLGSFSAATVEGDAVPPSTTSLPTTAAQPTTTTAQPTTTTEQPTTTTAQPTTTTAQPTTTAAQPTTTLAPVTTTVQPAATCSALMFQRPPLWRQAALGDADWSPLVVGSSVFTVHRARSVVAHDTNGVELWTRPDVTVLGGAAQVAATNEILVCTRTSLLLLNPATGAVERTLSLPPSSGIPCVKAPATVADMKIFVGTSRGIVLAFDVASGSLLWQKNHGFAHFIEGVLSVYGSNIVAASRSGRIFVHQMANGVFTFFQTPDVQPYIVNGPVFGVRSGSVVVGDFLFYSTFKPTDNFHRLNLVPMELEWSIPLSDGFAAFTTPTLYDGKVLTTTGDGKLFLVDMDGNLDVNYDMGDLLHLLTTGPIAVFNDVAFLQSNYGFLDAVSLSSGPRLDQVFDHTLGTVSAQPTAVGSALIVAGGLRTSARGFTCTP